MSNQGLILKISTADSARFGLVIARGRSEHGEPLPSPLTLKQAIQALSADVAIIRLPAGSAATMQGLAELGFVPFHADTLVYYEKELGTAARPVPEGIRIDKATPDDSAAVAAIARNAFGDYASHYHANPLLDRRRVLEGYAEWATKYLEGVDCVTWVARSDGNAVAFLSSTCNTEDATCEVVLNAVAPTHEKRGIYTQLLRHATFALQAQGFKRLLISTQVWNYGVQRIWAREGLGLVRAYDTYHVNSLLSAPMKTDRDLINGTESA